MNNGRTAAVMMLMAAMLVGMIGIAPAAPIANASPDVATSSPTYTQVLQDWVEYLDESGSSNKLDSALTSFKETGNVPLNVAVDSEGRASVIIAIANGADIEGLKNVVSVDWMLDFKAATVVSAHASRAALSQLEIYNGVAAVVSDYLYEARTEGMESRPGSDSMETEPDMYMSKDWIGATDVLSDYGYNGDGVVVGVTDTGVDFSHPDLKDAYYYDPFDGSPGSYDPSGYGMVWTGYRLNATTLENATRYAAASSWNKLSFSEEGNVYVSDFDPYLHDRGNLNNLDAWYYESYLAAWWEGTYPNEANLTEFYYEVMRQPLELPDPSLTSGSTYSYTYYVNGTPHTQVVPVYFYGWLFQQRAAPYMKVFAPLVVLNGTYLVVDWDTCRAYTEFWNYNINWGVFDFNDTDSWTYFENIGDWSFVDDWADGHWYSANGGLYGVDHLVLAHDYTGDSVDDFGLGAISCGTQYYFGGVYQIPGRALGGRMWSVLYDTDAHGTFVTGQIAGRGNNQYPVGLNYTYERLYGIANGSKIIGEMAITAGGSLGSNVWEAGFDLNLGSGYFEYNPLSNHSAVVSSNSWGWIAPSYYELWPMYSLMYAALSTPGYFDPAYPGILYCFSAGNEGPGYGTMTPPSVAQALHVGATTAHHTFQNSYGPNQGWDQIAEFSSRGGTSVGYPKPDVVAPGRSVYGIVPAHGGYFLSLVGAYVSYATYAGTSMSCPQVAGVVALMYEADSALMPDEAKTIVQNTALDLGLDPLIQGHGRVDAYAAIVYVLGDDGVVFSTYDSTANYAAAVAEAWEYWMTAYATGDVFINDTAMPTDFADGSLYYGVVDAGDFVPLTMTGTYYDGGAVGTADYTWQSMHYAVDNVWTDTWLTYTYLENTSSASSVKRGGWFVLSDEMDGASYTNFLDAPFATLYASGPASLDGKLWAFVFDWDDSSPANGVPDYYNRFTGLGDELKRIQYGGDMAVWKTDIACATGIGDLFSYEPIVLVNDGSPVVTGGHNITVTITTWKLVDDGEIAIGDKVGGGLWANLTVPAGADPGVHAGFVVLDSMFKIPYSYVVRSVIDTSNGEELVIADGFGDDLNPYENGASFEEQNADYDYSGDFHSFVVHVANSSAAYIGARVDWDNADSDFDVSIVTMYGYEIALSETGVGGAGASAIAELPSAPGDYIVQVRTYALGAPQPTNFTLKVICWEEIPEPTLTLSWYSRDHPTQTVLTAGGTAAGDHVVLNATWTDAVLPGMPDYQITTVEMKILRGLLFSGTGDLVIPAGGYDPFTGNVQLGQFAWMFVPGIETDDNVRVTIDFTNGDCDIMAWWAGTDNSSWSYGNNLLGSQTATGANPEYGEFIADQDGTLAVGVFDFDGAPGTFTVTVDTRAGLEPAGVAGKTFEIDTYDLEVNGLFAVLVSSDTGTNVKFSVETPSITLKNYFNPVLANIAVTGTGAEKSISWDVSDVNADDTHTFEVLVSADEGLTWQLLSKDLTAQAYTWDSTGFYILDYMVQVRATDSYGLSDSIESVLFEAGTVSTVTVTTSTTTTTTVTGIEILYIGLIGGIGVGVVIVLILFLVRKK